VCAGLYQFRINFAPSGSSTLFVSDYECLQIMPQRAFVAGYARTAAALSRVTATANGVGFASGPTSGHVTDTVAGQQPFRDRRQRGGMMVAIPTISNNCGRLRRRGVIPRCAVGPSDHHAPRKRGWQATKWRPSGELREIDNVQRQHDRQAR